MIKETWLQVRLTKGQKEKLRKAAKERNITISDIIVEFIDNLEV